MNWKGKNVLITGATRGIGKAIGLRLAKEGANIGVIGKTSEPHPKLEGTVFTAAEEMNQAGGQGLPLVCDIRDESQAQETIKTFVEKFGGIDILINNASAISLTPVAHTPAKRYDLMMSVNARGTYLMSHLCLPFLKKSEHAHILTMSPPIDLSKKWIGGHAPYTLSKYGMSLLTMGLSEELKDDGVCANTLWPLTTIATAAVKNLLGGDQMMNMSRTPAIVADAAYHILSSKESGNHFIDQDVLNAHGVTDFEPYRVNSKVPLMPDLFIEPNRVS